MQEEQKNSPTTGAHCLLCLLIVFREKLIAEFPWFIPKLKMLTSQNNDLKLCSENRGERYKWTKTQNPVAKMDFLILFDIFIIH